MTEGTSQGLFVVVAIVIFGIFVGISYVVFGDTLKPSMVNIFTDATEQAGYTDVVKEETDVNFFDYTETSKGITINKYTGTETDIVIPKEIDGKPVTEIGSWAFYNGTIVSNKPIKVKLTSVVIPDTVTKIGSQAFYNNLLTSVEIPNTVTSIGSATFSSNRLTNVVIPNSVTTIGSTAFYNNLLTSLEIPNSVTTIGSAAFQRNLLTSVEIGNSVTEIGSWAFYNNLLTNVEIPDSVTTIGTGAFTENTSLKTVELPYGFTDIESRFQSGAIITNRTK